MPQKRLNSASSSTREARSFGYSAVTGDASYEEVLNHAGLRGASFVVVTIPGAASALRIVNSVRLRAPDTRILVRARFNRSIAAFRAAGAHVVLDEEHEVGRLIGRAYEEMVRRPIRHELSPPA